MAQLKRLVLHCTATPEGREVSAVDIRHWHTDPVSKGGRGWKQVEDAQVDPWEITNGAKGYNSTSRHVVYVGGVAADGKTPKDTRTSAQKKAMEAYVKDFHRRFPSIPVVGHNQLAAKACPSFDVQAWLKEIGINQ